MSTGEDVSITATDATVAGSSVAITEAEEDAASFTTSENSNKEKVILTKEALLDISISNSNGNDDEEELDEGYAAPMHLHALRTPAKLKGAPRSRSSSRSRPGSRRNSASPPRGAGGELILGGTVSPSISVSSSLDGIGEHQGGHTDIIDPDILLDKLGFRDLDANVTQEELQELLRKHISSNNGLPTLNERMSEDTMDDVHAFQDLQFVSKKSRSESAPSSQDEDDGEDSSPEKSDARRERLKNSGQGLSSSAVMGSMSYLLKTLDEGEEEGDEDEGGDVILEIPEGLVSGVGEGKPNNKKNRDSLCSTMAVAGTSSIDDDEDDDNAEVEVPTSVMDELKISEERRKLKHRDTSVAQAGGDFDFLEDDEQDGLEADLTDDDQGSSAPDDDEPR
mmetsp:Transcript_1781/g.3818  ORF Transcript_1781/g.3818 Transcript_1781/m.3818 type:complete len:394 (+) Transcript_1781:153-1334(+)